MIMMMMMMMMVRMYIKITSVPATSTQDIRIVTAEHSIEPP